MTTPNLHDDAKPSSDVVAYPLAKGMQPRLLSDMLACSRSSNPKCPKKIVFPNNTIVRPRTTHSTSPEREYLRTAVHGLRMGRPRQGRGGEKWCMTMRTSPRSSLCFLCVSGGLAETEGGRSPKRENCDCKSGNPARGSPVPNPSGSTFLRRRHHHQPIKKLHDDAKPPWRRVATRIGKQLQDLGKRRNCITRATRIRKQAPSEFDVCLPIMKNYRNLLVRGGAAASGKTWG